MEIGYGILIADENDLCQLREAMNLYGRTKGYTGQYSERFIERCISRDRYRLLVDAIYNEVKK